MTDLEITKLCAEAMEIDFGSELYATTEGQQMNNARIMRERIAAYDPLHDDAQAMALVKKFDLWLDSTEMTDGRKLWSVGFPDADIAANSFDDLNLAICDCVAKMQQAKASEKNCDTA